MITPSSGYGLWFFAFINAAIFILFAFSFFKPQTPRDWRSFGAFSAFLVALIVLHAGDRVQESRRLITSVSQ